MPAEDDRTGKILPDIEKNKDGTKKGVL